MDSAIYSLAHFFTFIPTIVLWAIWWQYLIQYKKTIVYVAVFSAIWGIIFDIVAGPIFNIWEFNAHSIGIWIFGVPIEEYISALLMPQLATIVILLIRRQLYD